MFVLNPYKLSFLNIGLFALFLFWFLKFKPKLIIAIIVLSILPIVSFFRNTDFNGGMVQNAAFLASFYQSISEGNIIPRWAESLDTFFGYPAYLYLYPLPFYIGSIFHLLGSSFINSSKLVFVSTYIISGIWMWKWARLKFKPWPAFAVAIAYLFAPYRFINIHFRLDIGESVAIALLPLLFYYLDKNIKAGIVLGAFFLILAHPAISVSGLGLAIIYLCVKAELKKILLVFIGVLMAGYYWLPIILESQYANVAHYTKAIEFFPWHNYVFSPFRFGLLYQGGAGLIVFPIGYTLIFVIILSFIKINKINKRIKFWLAGFLGILFMLLPQSLWLWNNLPLIDKFQFSYRLMGIMTVITAIITGYYFQSIKTKLGLKTILFVIVTTGITILNWGNREYRAYSMPDFELIRLLPYQSRMWGTGFPQALPKWTNIQNLWGPEKVNGPIEIISGTGNITQIYRNSTKHEYKIIANSDLFVRENTFYYPGWKLFINGKERILYFENTTEPGAMEFDVPMGENNVVLVFKETPLRKFALLISTITAVGILYFLSKDMYI